MNLLRSKAVIRCTAEAPSAEAMAGEVEDCGFEAKVISESCPSPWIFDIINNR